MQTRFPQDICCIVDPVCGKGGIYVSNIEVAENPKTLEKHGIGSVITAIKGKNLGNVIPRHIQYLYIPVVDSEQDNISRFFAESNKFIEEQRGRTNVLVHCMAGISRSIALIIAYLMEKEQKGFSEVYRMVKNRRNIIHPNQAFIQQLKQFEKKLFRQPLNTLAQSQILLKPREVGKIIDVQRVTNSYLDNNKCNQSYTKSYASSSDKKTQNLNSSRIQEYDSMLRQNITNLFRNKQTTLNQTNNQFCCRIR